jgi:hypothetical protein
LSKEEIKYCTTNKELDATVIELTDAGVERLHQFGVKFTRVTSASGGDKIAQAQYVEAEVFIDKGAIHEIKDNEVYYYFGGALGNNGSPIFLWDYRAIGMNKPSGALIEHRTLVPIRHGNSLLASAVAVLRYTREVLNRDTTSTLTFLE